MAVTVDFHVLEGSGASTHSLDQANTATRLFLVRWSERALFIEQMAALPHPLWGETCAVNHIASQQLSPETPPSVVMGDPTINDEVYTQNAGFNCLIVCRYTTDFSLAPWPCAFPKPEIPAGTQMVMRTRSSAQIIRVPARKFVSASNPSVTAAGYVLDPDGVEGRIYLPTTEFQLQWYYVDEPDAQTWEDDYVGKVNEVAFLGGEAETMLFEGFDIEPSTQFITSNPFCFTVTCHFRKRRIVDGSSIYGWNHEFALEGWDRVQMKNGAGQLVNRYLLADFTDMFVETDCSSGSSGSSSSSSGA